jgi:uncharacterized membrane protein YphA (DoxX/SURF4 family)
MKIAITIARLLLGLIFVVFGLNGFLQFLHMPPPEGQAGAFIGAMFGSGYLTVVFVLQLVGGALLLAGRFIPLGLTLLGPVIVNILLFHTFLAPAGLPLALVVSVLALVVLYGNRSAFAPLLKA